MRSISNKVWIGLFAATTWAGTITYDPGTVYVISPGMQAFTTTGEDMVGMVVTATFDNGDIVSATWADDAFTSWPAGLAEAANRFKVRQEGDTYGFTGGPWYVENRWYFSGRYLKELVIDGPPGGIVFDLTTTSPDVFGTPGSAQGYTFSEVQSHMDFDVVYRNLARIKGSTPVGDLYTQMVITFAGKGLPAGDFIQFNADTDEIPPGASIIPDDPRATPEPSTAAFALAGLALVVAGRRKLFTR